ncbi:uncharacterized protein LOC125681637 [Ostrea edulis]|nr:uncharacterized protein LOC125681637 [Ostrea edulis]
MLKDVSEALLSLQDEAIPSTSTSTCDMHRGHIKENRTNIVNHDQSDTICTGTGSDMNQNEHVKQEQTQKNAIHCATQIQDCGTQTTFHCSDILANKIERRLRKNEGHSKQKSPQKQNTKNKFDYEQLATKGKLFKFYTGLNVEQFNHFFKVLENAGGVYELKYWKGNKTKSPKKRRNDSKQRQTKLSTRNQLLLVLMKLRHRFPNKDLAYRYGVSISTVSSTINTWIQYLYKVTGGIRKKMFPSRALIQKHLPACFRSFKNVRVIIDCFEIFTQSSRDFAEQGNMYSSYKNNPTLKCLVGVAPTGAVTFLSDVYEGSISDKEITVKSGLADLLNPGDLVIADRGFLIRDILNPRKVDLNIPPFLSGRDRLTPQEEILTKRIARVRIHVERAIERMKKFKIIGTTIPLSLKPVATEIVHIIGFLVNYQSPLVK